MHYDGGFRGENFQQYHHPQEDFISSPSCRYQNGHARFKECNKSDVFNEILLFSLFRQWRQELEFPMFWNWANLTVDAEDLEFVRRSKRITLVENIKLREKWLQLTEYSC